MTYEYIIDSYAWVEYFRGSEKGRIAKEYIENKNSATASIILAELSEKYKRENMIYPTNLIIQYLITFFLLCEEKILTKKTCIKQEEGGWICS